MTKLSNLTPKVNQPAKIGRVRKSQALSNHDNWNPNKPFHVTQEELWNHIHEIEQGPFMTAEECFNNVRTWMKKQGRDLL